MKVKMAVPCENGDGERILSLPGHHEVCPRCEGRGTHLNPSIGEHAYTPKEFAESFDEDQAAEYFSRGGIYDVTCCECEGKRVVAVLDRDALLRHRSGRRILGRIDRRIQADREFDEYAAMERMYGC